jgi:amino acid transporter/nucleotide-binding universal stress UspA family protein
VFFGLVVSLGVKKLGWFLCWAVVFADIGTSVYYVPGLLYGQVGGLAPVFVLLTGVAFIFLAVKYVAIAARYREGGGVVAVSTHAFGPYAGAFGGMLITVDYFLTTAISSVSGLTYFDSLVPLGHHQAYLMPAVIACLILLGILNVVGVKESAKVSAAIAVAAFIVDLAVVGVVAAQLGPQEWRSIGHAFAQVKTIGFKHGLIGFAAAWLAFSGLESIAQLSPAMALPRKKTARIAVILLVLGIFLTSPLLTAFSTGLDAVNKANADRFISELGFVYGGTAIKVCVVMTASVLLLFAANTAILGGYHVFIALARERFLPEVLTRRNPRLGTPMIAIAVTVVVPIAVIVATKGDMDLLGSLYAFGLLGAFTMASSGLDWVRWREKQRGPAFWIGLLTTIMIATAWVTNIIEKPLATYFGGGITLIGMAMAVGIRRGWLDKISIPIPYLSRKLVEQAAAASPSAAKILTVDEAVELRPVYHPKSLLAIRGGPNESLLERAVERLHETKETLLYLLFIDEVPGLLYPAGMAPSPECNDVLAKASSFLEQNGITAVPVWRVGHRAGETIASACEEMAVKYVLIGTSRRTPLWKLLRGSVVRDLSDSLPKGTQLVVVH